MKIYWTCQLLFLLLVFQVYRSYAWDMADDLELFDVVEDVGESFYKLLGVAQDVKTPDIRRAYRKLSLQMHPDKNDSPDAEVKFRQLVSVYEVLKDEEKRQRYDVVLRDGLPDWRQPIYYYRKARKMSVVELFVFLSVILTVGHYIVAWSIYLEKKFEMEELMNPVRKKMEKKKAKGKLSADNDELEAAEKYLEEQIGCKRPELTDLLPFLICRGTVYQLKMIPSRIFALKEAVQAMREARQREAEISDESDDDDEDEEKKQERRKRRRKVVASVRDASEYEAYEQASHANASSDAVPLPTSSDVTQKREWTVKDTALLTRAMVKFPGGTPGRWEKVAQELGRNESEVTKQVKKMRSTPTTQAYTKPSNIYENEVVTKKRPVATIDDSVMTKQERSEELEAKESWKRDSQMTQDDVPDDFDDEFEEKDRKRRRKKKQKEDKIIVNKIDENEQEMATQNGDSTIVDDVVTDDPGLVWSQSQQKCLELALAQFNKTVPERWVCIARAVPGKTKEDCFARYKELVARVRQRQTTSVTPS